MTEHTLRVLLVEDDATSCMEIISSRFRYIRP